MNTTKTILFAALATAFAYGCKRDVTVVEQPQAPAEAAPDGPMENAGEEMDENAAEGDEEDVEEAADDMEDAADEAEEEVDRTRTRG